MNTAIKQKAKSTKPPKVEIIAGETYYRELNQEIRRLTEKEGVRELVLKEVYGQRYIGTDIKGRIKITIHGTPGNDLGAFMNGPKITVHGNAQDGTGNTMNCGRIVVHGHAGDILGMGMRGGEIFIRDDVGYRMGIHMKEYNDKVPVVVVGGTAQDFFCEYMAGGVVMLLGLSLKPGKPHLGRFIGTGMHGGRIFIRGDVKPNQLGKEVGERPITDEDKMLLEKYVVKYTSLFGGDPQKILKSDIKKYVPVSLRPYGNLYAY